MKKMIIGLLALSAVVGGCAPAKADDQQQNQKFVVEERQDVKETSYFVDVLTDKDTGVQYLIVVNNGGHIAVTPRVNRDGNPFIP